MTQKLVNGELVDLTPEEQAEYDAAQNAPVVEPVPAQVTNYQARTALINAGLFAKADTAVRNSGDQLTIQAWDYANVFYRNSPFIATMAGALDITTAQVDDLFRAADKVV